MRALKQWCTALTLSAVVSVVPYASAAPAYRNFGQLSCEDFLHSVFFEPQGVENTPAILLGYWMGMMERDSINLNQLIGLVAFVSDHCPSEDTLVLDVIKKHAEQLGDDAVMQKYAQRTIEVLNGKGKGK